MRAGSPGAGRLSGASALPPVYRMRGRRKVGALPGIIAHAARFRKPGRGLAALGARKIRGSKIITTGESASFLLVLFHAPSLDPLCYNRGLPAALFAGLLHT